MYVHLFMHACAQGATIAILPLRSRHYHSWCAQAYMLVCRHTCLYASARTCDCFVLMSVCICMYTRKHISLSATCVHTYIH